MWCGIPDGCSDEPTDQLDGRTPLEVAELPILRGLAARGTVGRAAVIPTGMPAGSDVGNMSILGYDPALYHTGRAPIEAAALGLTIGADEIAFRCNLVTIGDDETMVDFAGGHPSSETAAEVIAALQSELGDDGVRFPPGPPVPPHRGGAGDMVRCGLHAAARSQRQAGRLAHRRGRHQGPPTDGRIPRRAPPGSN